MTIKEFVDENRPLLKKLAALVGGVYLCRVLGIDVPISANTSSKTQNTVRYIYAPSNYIEEAIKSIADTAVKTTSNYSKECSSNEIIKILTVNKANLSDSTKTYAVNSLKKIAFSATSAYTRECITNDISKIATGRF